MMHFPLLIRDLAVILGGAALASVVFQLIRQPIVLGYLLAGLVIGPHTPPFSWVVDESGIQIWSELGMIFLMFSLGLEFSFRKLLSVGKTAAIAGPFEALFMLALGFGAGKLMGLSSIDSAFVGAILSISSTTIIVRTLEELRMKGERASQLAFGILVTEDLMGILILIAVGALIEENGAGLSTFGLLKDTAKLLLVVAGWVAVGSWTVPRLSVWIGRRFGNEALMLFSLSLCLALSSMAAYFHYSVALGAFVMGAILGESPSIHQIEKLVTPVRDVFAAVFFVATGMLLDPLAIRHHWGLVLVLTFLTLVGKVLSTFWGARMTGQPRAVALRVGLTVAQIGEFSFIIAGLGLSSGRMSPSLYPVAIAVSILTTFTTPYLIRASRRFPV